MLCSREKNFGNFIPIYTHIGVESVLEGDSGPKGWISAGNRLRDSRFWGYLGLVGPSWAYLGLADRFVGTPAVHLAQNHLD
jgi:hypothetical protein